MAVHGSAPKVAREIGAIPLGAILTAAMMSDYFGYARAGKPIDDAVVEALKQFV